MTEWYNGRLLYRDNNNNNNSNNSNNNNNNKTKVVTSKLYGTGKGLLPHLIFALKKVVVKVNQFFVKDHLFSS